MALGWVNSATTPTFKAAFLQLSGSMTALATPFSAGGEIDFPAWQRLLDSQLAAGSSAIIVAGSTGEAAALSEDETSMLIGSAVEHVRGRIPVLAGTGLANTNKTIAQTRLARNAGAVAALVVTPPYVRPTQEGLIAHYRAVAEHGGLPVVLYNVPGRTGCDLLPETVAQLCQHTNIIGIKEARSEPARWGALYPLRSSQFALLSGDDPSFLCAMRGGADGVISVASNVVPATFQRLCALQKAGRDEEAAMLDARLGKLYEFLAIEPNPIPIKALLQRLGMGASLRLPLLPLSAMYSAQADAMAVFCRDIELTPNEL